MKLKKYAAAAAALLAIGAASCSKDGDLIYTNGADDLTANGTEKAIVLDKDHLSALALTVYWNDNGYIGTSDPQVAMPSELTVNTLQMASSEAFTDAIDFTMDRGVYEKQFTVAELNSAVGRLGFDGGTASDLYIRVRGTLAPNVEPKYSNVLKVSVTPYTIDMTRGFVLDASRNDTGRTLLNDGAGIYTGFIGAASWENWYMLEGNGTVWGNEATNWTAFLIAASTDGDAAYGNFWFPEPSGCYWTEVNTVKRAWSALYLPVVTLGGDLTGEMEYDRKANVWRYVFTATPGTLNVTLSADARLYDQSTATDNNAAIAKAVAFGGSPEALTFGEGTAQTIAVNVTESGEATLELNLSDPTALTLKVTGGAAVGPEPAAQQLFMAGVDDGWTEPDPGWNFDHFLTLYNEDELLYGGAINLNSRWGYKLYSEPDWGATCYGMVAGGTAWDGELVQDGENLPMPENPGLYVLDVSLSKMTYKLTAFSEVGYAGLNDDWNVYPMTRVEECVFEATVEKTANTPWGVKIILDNDWNLFFGGGSGTLRLYQDGFDGDNDLENGTYTLRVDLANATYSYTPVE